MSPFDVVLLVYAIVLALTALSVVYRMVVGPTILDRAVSTDSLVVLVVLGMALYTAFAEAAWAGPAMLGLTGLAFIGTVTFARFVAREDPLQGRQQSHAEEESTDTGRHEAIHVDHEPTEVPATTGEIDGRAASGAVLAGRSAPDEDADDLEDSESGFGAHEGSDRGFESPEEDR